MHIMAETTPEIATEWLREECTRVLKRLGIGHGMGPAFPHVTIVEEYALTPGGLTQRRFEYRSFGMNGEKQQGQPGGTSDSVHRCIADTVMNFERALKPHHTLVWRTMPEMEVDQKGERWSAFMRFAQLDKDYREIMVLWHIW